MYPLRRAAVNRTLIIVLALTAVAAVIYWGFFRERAPDPNVLGPDDPKEMVMYCTKCGEILVPTLTARKLPKDSEGHYQCFQCKEMTAGYTKPPKPGSKAVSP